MQFSIFTVLTLAAAVIATPFSVEKRDVVDNAVLAEAPAMTNANGDVIAFDSKNVHQAAKAQGL